MVLQGSSDHSSQTGQTPPASERRTSLLTLLQKASGLTNLSSPPCSACFTLVQFCFGIPLGRSLVPSRPSRHLAFSSCFDTFSSLCWETSCMLLPPSDSQLLSEVLAHSPPSSGKSFGLGRECNQQPFPPPSSLIIAVCRQYLCCFVFSASAERMLKYLPTEGEVYTNTKDNEN